MASAVAEDSAGLWKTRYTILVLCLLGLAISYATRVNISVAIVDMVNNTALRTHDADAGVAYAIDPDACPGEFSQAGATGRKEGEFKWDTQMQGEILAGFYYGYTAGHIPGGVLADRFGGKVVFGIGVLTSSLLTILTPLSAWAGYYVLFFNRLAQGFLQGGVIPASQTIICRWAPDNERSIFSVIFFGIFIGPLVSMAATGALCETSVGWPLTFYLFGGLGVLWCLPWYLLVADSPSQHQKIDPAERSYIKANIQSSAKKNLPVPWKSILTTPAVWALVALMITFDWTFYLLISSLPQYISNILHFNISSNGLISAIPQITGGAGSLLCVWLTDLVLRRRYLSKLTSFRIINALGTLVPAVTMVVVALVGCNSTVIIFMLALSGLFTATDCTGSYMNMQAIAPNYAGTIVGIVNMFANLTGIAVPYVVGALTNANQTRAAWNSVFYLSAAVAAVSYAFYAIFTTAEEQPWNVPPAERGCSLNNLRGVDNVSFNENAVQQGRRRSLAD